MKRKFILILFLLTLFAHLHAEKATIQLEVSNIECLSGDLYVSLYNKSDQFLKQGAEYRKLKFDVTSKGMCCSIENLPEGDYAIAIYHDKNEDGECNTNWLGIPTEGYGFSCNFKPVIAPPSFKKVKIKVTGKTSVKIKMLNAK